MLHTLAFASVSKAAAAHSGPLGTVLHQLASSNGAAEPIWDKEMGVGGGGGGVEAANRSRHLKAEGDREKTLTMQRVNALKGCF